MRDGRAADLPGAVLRRPLAGPGRLPAPGRRRRRTSATHAYEVLDTKLARQVKPHVVHQLSLYSRLLAEVQGFDAGARVRDPRRRHDRCRSSSAATRRCTATSSRASSEVVGAAGDRDLPRAGRPLRDLRSSRRSAATRRVARRPPQPRRRRAARPARAARRPAARDGARRSPRLPRRPTPARSAPSASTLLRHQAALQVESRDTRRADPPPPATRARGRATRCCPTRAPATSSSTSRAIRTSATAASSTSGAGGPRRPATSASGRTTPTRRRRRFERFVDRVVRAARAASRTCTSSTTRRTSARSCGRCRSSTPRARTRSTSCCATSVLVDLYAVVRQGAAGRRGELLAEEARAPPRLRAPRDDACARAAARSSPTRPGWRRGDDELLEAIRAYNEEDCRSTLSLRDWLLDDDAPRGRG